MTPAEHYMEAERLANRADEIGASGVRLDPGDPLLLLAQVHATLATAPNPALTRWEPGPCAHGSLPCAICLHREIADRVAHR